MAIHRAGEVLPFEIWYLERLDLTKLESRAAFLLDGNVKYGSDQVNSLETPQMEQMLASLAEKGQIEPVCVWGHEPGLLRIMVGHNRAQCLAELGDPFVKALVSIRVGDHAALNEMAEPESLIEAVEPLTLDALRSYFEHEPRSMNLNRRGWGVTPAATETF